MIITKHFIEQIQKFLNSKDDSSKYLEYSDDISEQDFIQFQKEHSIEFLLLELRCEISRRYNFIRNIFLWERENTENEERINKQYLISIQQGEFSEYKILTLLKNYFKLLETYKLKTK